MSSPAAEWVRNAVAGCLGAEADEARARALGSEIDAAARAASRARSALGGGEGRERLEEAVTTRALDAASYAALLEHLARIAELEVLARRNLTLSPRSSERVVLEDRERTLLELTGEARGASHRARPALAAIAEWASRERPARLEAFADASERRARIRSRGPALPDDAPGDLGARCQAFLSATDDATADLVARAHHACGSEAGSIHSLVGALAPSALDGFVSPRGRSRRVGAVFEALELGGELARVEQTATERLAVSASVLRTGSRATILLGGIEAGIASEAACLSGVATALALVLVSRALPIEHTHAPRASVARAIGALAAAWIAQPAFALRHLDVDGPARARIRVASSAALALRARHACVALVAGPASGRSDEAARELTARALSIDPTLVSPELARSSWILPVDLETHVRATLGALAWAPALRERYDEDFFRNPRLADFVRGAAARGGLTSVEAVSEELGATPGHAAAHIVELAENAGG